MAGILNIQLKPVIGNKELNLKKVEHFIKKFENKKLDLVVLPEFFSTGISHDAFENHPEDENGGETIAKIKEFAKKYNTNIVAGTVIEKSGDKLYNTMFVVNRCGETVAKYRKIHLYNYMGGNEGELITPGDEIVTAELDFAKLGLGVCFDIRYPMHYNKLIKENVDIIVLPTAWVIPTEVYKDIDAYKYAQEMWIAMNRTRAYDNMVYTISCDQVGVVNDKVSCLGTSLVIGPNTEVLAQMGNMEEATYTEIEIDSVKYYRQIYPIATID